MRILFDQGTPVPVRRYLGHHAVSLSAELGWSQIRNGDLLVTAEQAGFELLLTTDKNLRYQQNLKGRAIAIVVIGQSQCPRSCPHVQRVVDAIDAALPGSYAEVDIPYGKPG